MMFSTYDDKDGCIGAYDSVQQRLPIAPFVKANNQHFKFDDDTIEQIETTHETCGHKNHMEKYLTFPAVGHQPRPKMSMACNIFDQVRYKVMRTNPCFNV
jgi:carboxypeptidase D